MKKVIRNGVFETNSSSTHSVTCVDNSVNEFNITLHDIPPVESLKVDESLNKVFVKFGDFGHGPMAFNDPLTKLSYALTMIAETEARYIASSNLFYETPGFKALNELIKDELHCDGIYIDDDINIDQRDYGSFINIDGYIDHQSGRDEYDSLDEFINHYNVTLYDYIFDPNVVLIISNDNAYPDEYDFVDYLNGGDGYNKNFVDPYEPLENKPKMLYDKLF